MLKDEIRRRRSLLGVMWFIAGTVLLAASLLSFFTESEHLLSISPFLGLAMFVSGLADILTYTFRRKVVRSVDWVLANGLTSCLMSLYLMFNQVKTVDLVLLFFGLWELFSGILKSVDCIELKRDSVRGWLLFALAAAVKIISGAVSLIKPVEDHVDTDILIGVIILVQAVVYFIKIGVFPHLIEINTQYERTDKGDEAVYKI